MFVGHLALALASKGAAPAVSLGWLMAAVTALDLVWPIFLLTGVEQVGIVPGATAFTPLVFDHYPWSHKPHHGRWLGPGPRRAVARIRNFAPHVFDHLGSRRQPLGAGLHHTRAGHALLAGEPASRARALEFHPRHAAGGRSDVDCRNRHLPASPARHPVDRACRALVAGDNLDRHVGVRPLDTATTGHTIAGMVLPYRLADDTVGGAGRSLLRY